MFYSKLSICYNLRCNSYIYCEKYIYNNNGIIMKCSKCGYENKDTSKFCTKCGSSLFPHVETSSSQNNTKSKNIIVILIIIIVILCVAIGYFAYQANFDDSNEVSQENASQEVAQSDDSENESDVETHEVASEKASTSKVSDSKSWESIGVYSGSGSGSETINVPEGKILVKLSAYPIKNYATNHLYVTGSNGEGGGVDWGSKSAVETRSDSFEYTSSSQEVFTIDYYETVNWEVEFFRYQ